MASLVEWKCINGLSTHVHGSGLRTIKATISEKCSYSTGEAQEEHQQTLTNMYLTFLIIGILLVPEADTLKCYECMSHTQDCISSEMQCAAEFNRCGAMKLIVINGTFLAPYITAKICLKAEQCIQGSVNFGVSRIVSTSRCCDSDLCNTQDAPDPQSPKNPNGKKCFHCDGQGDCTGTLNCEGDEDLCISSLCSRVGWCTKLTLAVNEIE